MEFRHKLEPRVNMAMDHLSFCCPGGVLAGKKDAQRSRGCSPVATENHEEIPEFHTIPTGFCCSLMLTSQNFGTLIFHKSHWEYLGIPLNSRGFGVAIPSGFPDSSSSSPWPPCPAKEGPGAEGGDGTGQQYPGGARADQCGDPTPAGEGRRCWRGLGDLSHEGYHCWWIITYIYIVKVTYYSTIYYTVYDMVWYDIIFII